MSPRRRIVRTLLILFGVAAAAFLAMWASLAPPGPPAQWSLVKKGMPRNAVFELIGPPTFDGKELKGFDNWHYDIPSRDAYYQLHLTYTQDDTVDEATLHFANRAIGLRNGRSSKAKIRKKMGA